MSHPDFLPTGKPVVGYKRSFGELPPGERMGVGVLGLHEGHTMLVALRESGMCRAVMGCDLSKEKQEQARIACPGLPMTDSYEEMLANPEVQIVAIYTPDPLHADQIIQAFRARKNVICTKPLINDASFIPLLLKTAEETGCRLQVGQSTRFYEPFLRQRELFEAGQIGEVEVVDAHYNHRMDWWYAKSGWSLTGTHWAYLGLSHPVDLVRWYLGEIDEVHAFGTTTSLGALAGLRSFDAITVNLLGTNGRIGRVLGNYGFHELPRARSLIECSLMGSSGSSLARYPDLRLTYTGENGVEMEEDYEGSLAGYHYRHELKGMHYGEFCNYADYFASCLMSGRANSPDLKEGLQTVLVMDAIVRSLESGKAEKVPAIERSEAAG